MLLLTFGLAVFAATAAAATPAALHTVYPEPALPPGWVRLPFSEEATGRDAASSEGSTVTLAVREQNMDTIREIALDVSNPDSSTYGKHLTQAQIDEITAPTAADVAAVRSWLVAEHFEGNVQEAQGGRLFVLTAPATAMGALLNTQFHQVTNAATGQTALRASSFALPTATAAAVAAVFGVHGLPLPPKRNPASATPAVVNPPVVNPPVLASTYNIKGVTVDRSGKSGNRQAVAEFQGQTMNSTDLATFFKNEVPEAQAGDDVVSKFVGNAGSDNTGTAGVEASLDIQYIMGVAPGVKTEFWYYSSDDFCGDLKRWTDAILIAEDAPLVHSVSYGVQGNLTQIGCKDANVATIDANFAKLAARGITIIFASGDSGSGYARERCAFQEKHFKDNTAHIGTVSGSQPCPSAMKCCGLSGGAMFTFKKPDSQFQCVPSKTEITGVHHSSYGGYFKESECCSASKKEGAGYIYDAKKRLCTIFSKVNGTTGKAPAAGIVSGTNQQGTCTWYSAVTGTVLAPGSMSGGTAIGTLWPSWPASSPWVTSVGATRFAGQKVGGEEVASDQFGSGGGFSTQFAQSPDATWQSAMVAAYIRGAPQLAPAGSFPPLGRATPDVSTIGEGYHVYAGGRDGPVGGTSASTPTFAALISLLNEARLQAKMPPMGFVNPFVYKHADTAFFDVVKGTNAIGRGTGPLEYGFNCTKGWDPATGVGTPHFGRLLAAAIGTANNS
jgi:subtilase family serine protease